MSNQQILEKAIQKAIANGWTIPTEFIADAGRADDKHTRLSFVDHRLFIFNHDFAWALWGHDPEDKPNYWQFHLQQMVIADDPIKYLGENI